MKTVSFTGRERMLIGIIIALIIIQITVSALDHDQPGKEPTKAKATMKDYLARKELRTASYDELEQALATQLPEGTSLYIEDLESGAHLGIKEEEQYVPGSLFKVPALVAIMKDVEEGRLELEQEITIRPADIDHDFGPLADTAEGKNYTVYELMEYVTTYSDNTADKALRRILSENGYINAVLSTGAIYEIEDGIVTISPKDYTNLLRSLYTPSYISQESANLILTLLSKSQFATTMASSLPKETMVSHKVGIYSDGNQNHDCGIVYAERPYTFCMMTKGMDAQDAFTLIKDISQTVYDSL